MRLLQVLSVSAFCAVLGSRLPHARMPDEEIDAIEGVFESQKGYMDPAWDLSTSAGDNAGLLEDVQACLENVKGNERHKRSSNAGLYEPKIMSLNVFAKQRQTMSECGEMVRQLFDTAKRWAIITTYAVCPKNKFDLKSTASALWESILKNWDEDKVMIFAYHRAHFNDTSSKCPAISNDPPTIAKGWNQAIVHKLASQLGSAMPWPRKSGFGKSKVIFIELSPIGIFGSWHTKFLINDQGLMGTTGCSIGNRAKPGWTDSGLMSHSPEMATQEKDFFLNQMLPHAANIARVEFIKKKVKKGPGSFDWRRDFAFRKVAINEVKDLLRPAPHNVTGSDDQEMSQLQQNIQRKWDTTQINCEALMIRSMGSKAYMPNSGGIGWASGKKRPIVAVMDYLFDEIEEGDIVWLRNGCPISQAHPFKSLKKMYLQWISDSMARGAHVKLMYNDDGKEKSCAKLFRDISDMLLKDGRDLFLFDCKTTLVDRVSQGTFQLRRIRARNYKGTWTNRDHSKTYSFEFKSKRKTAFAIGTYNLDVQSSYGSNEHLLLLDDTTGQLTREWIKNEWNAGALVDYEGNLIAKKQPLLHALSRESTQAMTGRMSVKALAGSMS